MVHRQREIFAALTAPGSVPLRPRQSLCCSPSEGFDQETCDNFVRQRSVFDCPEVPSCLLGLCCGFQVGAVSA